MAFRLRQLIELFYELIQQTQYFDADVQTLLRKVFLPKVLQLLAKHCGTINLLLMTRLGLSLLPANNPQDTEIILRDRNPRTAAEAVALRHELEIPSDRPDHPS